jgi:Ca-activated chloride channel family protein
MWQQIRSRNVVILICFGALVLYAQTAKPQLQILVTASDDVSVPTFSTSKLELKVDGHAVPVTSIVTKPDLPVRIGIVLDESGSVRQVGFHREIVGRSLDFIAELLKQPGSDAFLVAFNDEVIISTDVVTDADRLRVAASQLRPIGGSAVKDALLHSVQKFYSLGPESRPTARVLLFVSDGYDNASYKDEQRGIETAQALGVRVYPIALPSLQAATGRHLLEHICNGTGGRAFYPRDAQELAVSLATIRQDIAKIVMLTVIPPAHDGKFHKISLRVPEAPGLSFRLPPGFPAWKDGCYGPC